MTFTNGEKTAEVPHKDTYNAKDVISTLALFGIKKQSKAIYTELVSRSTTPTQPDLRIRHVITQDYFERIIQHFIQMQESVKRPNIRSFSIADETTIKLFGITDYKWKIYEPLLMALRATRKQIESGELQITPIAYEVVKRFFPENASEDSMFYTVFHELNKALAPNGWSVIREGEGTKKPVDAPWFLRGPDDNVVQNKRVSKVPKQEDIYASVVANERKERKRVAVEQFDRMAFGTFLLHLCLSNLTNPDAKAIFTNNPAQVMSSLLPTGLELQDIIGEKTPQEYFQESIQAAVNSMAGKNYEELSEKQKLIVPLWNRLKIDLGQRPDMVIFKHFSGHDSSKLLDQGNNDVDNLKEDIIRPNRTRGRPITFARAQKSPKDTIHF